MALAFSIYENETGEVVYLALVFKVLHPLRLALNSLDSCSNFNRQVTIICHSEVVIDQRGEGCRHSPFRSSLLAIDLLSAGRH